MEFVPELNGCLIKGEDLKKLFFSAKEALGVLIFRGNELVLVNTHTEKMVIKRGCEPATKKCIVFISYFFGDIEYYKSEIHDRELYAINFDKETNELVVEKALSGKAIFRISGIIA